MMFSFVRLHKQAQITAILDLFAEDNRLNVYAGKLEVRPPGAPTTQDRLAGGGRAARRARRAVFSRASSSVGVIRTF